jgi:hypothetical protein
MKINLNQARPKFSSSPLNTITCSSGLNHDQWFALHQSRIVID